MHAMAVNETLSEWFSAIHTKRESPKMTRLFLTLLLSLSTFAQPQNQEKPRESHGGSNASTYLEYCQILKTISAHLKSERRFRSMGNLGTAGKHKEKRQSLIKRKKKLLKNLRDNKQGNEVPEC